MPPTLVTAALADLHSRSFDRTESLSIITARCFSINYFADAPATAHMYVAQELAFEYSVSCALWGRPPCRLSLLHNHAHQTQRQPMLPLSLRMLTCISRVDIISAASASPLPVTEYDYVLDSIAISTSSGSAGSNGAGSNSDGFPQISSRPMQAGSIIRRVRVAAGAAAGAAVGAVAGDNAYAGSL